MRQFDKRYIEKELNNINNNISEHIDLYIFGGGAMSFFDLKDATKDIDVLVSTESEASILISSLLKSGYNKIQEKDPIYLKMRIREIIENSDGFRWDIFVRKVCGGLFLSKNMKNRAAPFKIFSNIRTYLLSPEDIFILKAVTSRPRDREDMFSLFSHGLDSEIILAEIKDQAVYDKERAWLSYFFVGLDELVDEYHIIFPGYEEYLRLAEDEMLEGLILELIERKPRTVNDLVEILKCNEKEVHTILKKFISSGKITFSNRYYQIT